jgi:hypothetical protein
MSGDRPLNTEAIVAEIRGDIKRIFDHIERHATDYRTVHDRLNNHSGRLVLLENDRSERVGMGKAIRWAYMALGGGIGTLTLGVVAVVARAMGV